MNLFRESYKQLRLTACIYSTFWQIDHQIPIVRMKIAEQLINVHQICKTEARFFAAPIFLIFWQGLYIALQRKTPLTCVNQFLFKSF